MVAASGVARCRSVPQPFSLARAQLPVCESGAVGEESMPADAPATWLRLESGGSHVLLHAHEGGWLRDELRSMGSAAAGRLATQLDVAVTVLDAAPLHAGTRAVRIAADERACLLDAARALARSPTDRFALLVDSFAID